MDFGEEKVILISNFYEHGHISIARSYLEISRIFVKEIYLNVFCKKYFIVLYIMA